MILAIGTLRAPDRPRWDILARGYKSFYETTLTDAEYDRAWHRLMAGDGVFGLGASLDGHLVGITHYLYHASTWSSNVCYLQDLFVDPSVRGQGIARALIQAVAREAKRLGSPRMYWLTRENNVTARILYDRVARFNGFIRYDYPIAE